MVTLAAYKNSKKTHYPKIQFFFSPQFSHVPPKVKISHPQEVLAKSGYKTNLKIKKIHESYSMLANIRTSSY
jgi:hypothetical protein